MLSSARASTQADPDPQHLLICSTQSNKIVHRYGHTETMNAKTCPSIYTVPIRTLLDRQCKASNNKQAHMILHMTKYFFDNIKNAQISPIVHPGQSGFSCLPVQRIRTESRYKRLQVST